MRIRLSLLLLPLFAACHSVAPRHDARPWPTRSDADTTSAKQAYVPPVRFDVAAPAANHATRYDVELPHPKVEGTDLGANAGASIDAGAGGGDASATNPAPAAVTPAEAAGAAPAQREQSHSEKDPWEFTIGGVGSNDRRFRNGTGSLQASLGYYLNDMFEIGVRQNVLFFEGTPDSWNGATRVFVDAHFPVWGFRPFIGAEGGWVYGDDIQDESMLGLEAGAKIDLREGTFLFVMGEYQWFFDDADEFDENFDDGSFLYSIGIGVRF